MAAGDRNQERKFREWLGKCHSQLDKSLHFGHLADPSVQVTSRCHHELEVILCSIKSRVRHGDNAVAIMHTEVQLVHAAAFVVLHDNLGSVPAAALFRDPLVKSTTRTFCMLRACCPLRMPCHDTYHDPHEGTDCQQVTSLVPIITRTPAAGKGQGAAWCPSDGV